MRLRVLLSVYRVSQHTGMHLLQSTVSWLVSVVFRKEEETVHVSRNGQEGEQERHIIR
jgi:hypothetical protein